MDYIGPLRTEKNSKHDFQCDFMNNAGSSLLFHEFTNHTGVLFPVAGAPAGSVKVALPIEFSVAGRMICMQPGNLAAVHLDFRGVLVNALEDLAK